MSDDPEVRWATSPAAAGALILAGVALGSATFFAVPDPVGRILVGFAALVALTLAASAALLRPRLEILEDGSGIGTFRVTGRRTHPRDRIRRVRIVDYPRLGRRVPMLEIDVDDAAGNETLLIFGRWDLGTDPRDVFDIFAARGLVPDQSTN